jgi:hypothetical protein
MSEPSKFDVTWKPLIGFGLLIGFGVQAGLAYINPAIIMLFVFLAGLFYNISHDGHAGLITGKGWKVFGIVVGVAAVFVALLGAIQFVAVMAELAKPCERLRRQLLAEPSSVAADTYNALHCPTYLPMHPLWRAIISEPETSADPDRPPAEA